MVRQILIYLRRIFFSFLILADPMHSSNHVGNYRWTEALKWTGHKAFNEQSLREWTVDGKAAGKTRGANGLTFATVVDAGHMVRCVPLYRVDFF